MKNFDRRKLNPLNIIVFWIMGCVLLTIVAMILLGISTSGGEQMPFVFLSKMIPITIYGVLVLSILSIPIYFRWVQKRWFINLFFIVLCSLYVYKERKAKSKVPNYSFSIIKQTVNNKEYEKRIEYYGNDFGRIRSISFTQNNKKDSIWTVYSETGSIIEQVKYNSDTLIEKIK